MNIPGLSNLGGIGKLLDPGALVKDVVNGFLPKDMKVVGDAAGAFVDFKCGNFIGAVQHGMEAVKDLPQAAKAVQGGAAKDAGGQLDKKPELEPSPPPPSASASGESKPLDMGGLFAAIQKLTSLLTDLLNKKGGEAGTAATKPDDASKSNVSGAPADGAKSSAKTDSATGNTPAAPSSSSSARGSGEHVHVHFRALGSRGEPSSPEPGTGRTDPQTAGWRRGPHSSVPAGKMDAQVAEWRGEPRSAAPTSETKGSSASAASNGSAATSASASKPAAESASAVNSSKGQTITSLDQIKGMTDSAIRDAVINGRISPEIAKDQTAMMVLQQRMNAITEMNNLMTSMMRALHDMQMAVIQNIRI
jgi:hypothetical protein